MPDCDPSGSNTSSYQVSTHVTTLGLHGFCLRSLNLPFLTNVPKVLIGTDVATDGIDEEEVISEDFQGLCAEVKAVFTELGCLEMSLRQQLLVNIGRILQDQSSMEALEASVSEHDGGGQGLPKPTWPHLPHRYLSWSRACAVAGRWSLWTAQQAASSSVWCSSLGNWWWNSLPLSSICWKHCVVSSPAGITMGQEGSTGLHIGRSKTLSQSRSFLSAE